MSISMSSIVSFGSLTKTTTFIYQRKTSVVILGTP